LGKQIYAGLTWLTKQRLSENGRLMWPVSSENNIIGHRVEHGFLGVALTFIKAYAVLGNQQYKLIASEVLVPIPLK